METTQVSIKGQMDKENVTYKHNSMYEYTYKQWNII